MMDIQWIPIVSSVLLLLAVALGLGPLGRVWDMISRRYTRDLLDLLAILEIDESKFNAWMRLWGFVLAATIFLMLFVCRMPLLAIAVSIIIIALPRIWMGILVKRRRTLLREQMAGACIAIANCARAGLSLDQALQTVADESANPLAGVLRRICRDYKANIPLAEAINRARHRVNIDTFSMFAVTITTCLEQGGKITEMLDRISKSIGEIRRLERRIESETAGGRRVVWVLALFPFFFLTVMALLHPQGTQLMFTTIAGQALLVASIVLISLSIAMSRKILSVNF